MLALLQQHLLLPYYLLDVHICCMWFELFGSALSMLVLFQLNILIPYYHLDIHVCICSTVRD